MDHTFCTSHDTRDKFYAELQATLDEVHQDDLLLLVGDFNARVGSNSRLPVLIHCGKKFEVIMAWEDE